MNRFFPALALLTSLAACTSKGAAAEGAAAKGAPTEGAAKALPACFFDGDMSEVVRVESVSEEAWTELELEWDALAPAGASWVPPIKVRAVDPSLGVGCLEPLEEPYKCGVVGQVAGDRELRVRLPAELLTSLRERGETHQSVQLTLQGLEYAADCQDLEFDEGEPLYMLTLELSISPGGVEVVAVKGDSGVLR